MAARVRDLRASDFPASRLEVVVGVDARAPSPLAEYERALVGIATVVRGDAPGGKAAGLNAAVRAASGDVLLFADSHQRFTPEVVSSLVRAVAHPGYGAVSGVIVPASDDALMDRYWEYELELRRNQAEVHSIICVSGAVYVLRRELWVPMPADLICDDLFVTQGLVLRGWRVGFCETARAIDPRTFTREQHFARKVRTLTGLLQLCLWMPAMLVPWRNAIWIDLVLHKLTRVVVPYLLLASVVGCLWLVLTEGGSIGRLTLGLSTLTVLVALAAWPRLRRTAAWAMKLFSVPLIATGNALRRRWQVWQPHTHPAASAVPTAPHPDATRARPAEPSSA